MAKPPVPAVAKEVVTLSNRGIPPASRIRICTMVRAI